MNTNTTIILVSVLAVAGIGGYLYYKSQKAKEVVKVTPTNAAQRDSALKTITDSIKSGADIYASLDDVYNSYGGY